MSTIVVEQPSYIPWVGYFDLMARADLWVWYDDVQYTHRDWRNRNRLAVGGEPVWLTIPVRSRAGERRPIVEVEIVRDRPWERKQLETLRHCCGQAPCFTAVSDLLRRHFDQSHRYLAELVISLNEAIASWLGLRTRFVRASHLSGITGRRQERLLAICRQLGARTYLSGPAARAYIDPAAFAEAAIDLRYMTYGPYAYPRGGQPFVPALSVLDPLAWLGAAGTASLLAPHEGEA